MFGWTSGTDCTRLLRFSYQETLAQGVQAVVTVAYETKRQSFEIRALVETRLRQGRKKPCLSCSATEKVAKMVYTFVLHQGLNEMKEGDEQIDRSWRQTCLLHVADKLRASELPFCVGLSLKSKLKLTETW